MTAGVSTVPDDVRGPVARVARRLGWTDGQVYTMAIGLGFAALLISFGLPATMGGPGLAAAGVEQAGPPPSTPTPTTPSPTTVDLAPWEMPPVGAATPVPATPRPPATPPSPDPPPVGQGSPPDASCATTQEAQPVVDALAATGVFPDQSTKLILARVTGCSETDPAVLLLSALAELGTGLPDPGVDVPILPLPFLEIPPELIEAVQPFRDAIDPMCDAVGEVSQVFFYGFGTWPAGIGAALGTPIRQVLLACGQLRPA